MHVGRRQPGPWGPGATLHLLALLPLALLLGSAEAPVPQCPEHTYPQGGRCCKDCPPGHGMERRCSLDQDTVCSPCQTGFYNEAHNYAHCKPCTQCNLRSGSEPRKTCTPEQDTVCVCKAGTQPQGGYKLGVDCVPCPAGHFSRGDGQACRPWTNCTLAGKRTQRPANSSADSVCESGRPPPTLAWETQATPAEATTASPTTVQPRASSEPPPGPELATILGLGLGLLGPVAALLVLLLCPRAWRLLHSAPKLPGASVFRTPIQEEHADADSPLAKI
ncbi:tumor necrosis factor receptor superfamily member 4 [Talpa occidentalis]|uniref:tumor necrosis factor receptor superfamily member 4 n=1 Tax=Talpa occidentalis TaxID=50954 RepID=UPI0023F83224|nr:tumor necrosis factor receptor superfamily member 4 [Talpa occidentalis]